MKIWNKSFVFRRRLYQGVLTAFLFVGLAVHCDATIYTVTSGAYTASYDTSQNGFTTWSSGGVNQLALQSLYLSLNGGAVSLLTGAVVNTGSSGFTAKYISATYSVAGGSVVDTLTINGNTLSEGIQFNNLSANSVNASLFQYSDFVIGGPSAAGSQSLNMTTAPVSGGYAIANQSGGGYKLTWQGDAPGFTTLVQANSGGAPFGPFIGLGSNLDNATLNANNSAVFGYEFSGTVLSGNLLSVSENAAYPVVVPEPSIVALISSGVFALALMLRRRSS